MSDKKFSPTLDTLQEFLQKARRRLSDEDADHWERSDDEASGYEDDLHEEDDSANISEDDLADMMRDPKGYLERQKQREKQAKKPKRRDEEPQEIGGDLSFGDDHDEEPEHDEDDPRYDEDVPDFGTHEEQEVAAKKPVGPTVRRKAEPAVATKPSSTPQKKEEVRPTPTPTPASPERRRIEVPSGAVVHSAPRFGVQSDNPLQPSREELQEIRHHTRKWEQHARDYTRLKAEAHVNPHKHHQGRIVEARALTAADRQRAYEEFINSPDYQNADPITQMDMDAKFHEDWKSKNPDHIKNTLQAHSEAHKKGSMAKDLFNQAKDEKIRHIAGGGAQAGAYSVEEGLQHLGNGDREEDEAPTGISQDRATQFAVGNQEFLQQYMDRYGKRAKNFDPNIDINNFNDETRADISRILGDPPTLKDPAKKAKMDAFVARYYPQIEKAKNRVLSKLGLQDHVRSGQIDEGLLYEAGMHALFQAVNDYDHDHPSGASFVTHLNRKMHGLMQTALKMNDEVPEDMRIGAKKFDQRQRAANSAPVKHTDAAGNTRVIQPTMSQPAQPSAPAAPTPTAKPVAPVVRRPSHEIAAQHGPQVQERLQRIASAKQPLLRKPGASPSSPAQPQRKWNVRNVNLDDDNGEF